MKGDKEKVIAILTSDWHLREDIPVCRTDNFPEAQWDKVKQVKDLQQKHDCIVIHAGDLFHYWKPSPYLIGQTILNMPGRFYTVYGQHDLPNHNLKLKEKSGLFAVSAGGGVWPLDKGHWGTEPASMGQSRPVNDGKQKYQEIGVLHRFVWDGKNIPWPQCDEITAKKLLKKYPQFDLIVTGDYHKSFVVEGTKGRKVVNCGCLTRQDADYADHVPCVWLYYDSGKVEKHVLKYRKNVVTKEHIEKEKERDKRIEAFISRLNTEWEVAAPFEENLKRFLSVNKTSKKQIKTIYKAIESL